MTRTVLSLLVMAGLAGVAAGLGPDQVKPEGKPEATPEAKACCKEGAAKECADGKAGDCCPAGSPAAMLEPLRKLAGTWDVDTDGDGKPDGLVRYRVISGGSVVIEEEFPGTEHEMMTVFTADAKGVVATHYCHIGNQPRMRADGGMKDGVLTFTFVDGGNMTDQDKHMGKLVMTFKGEDRVVNRWTIFEAGKEAGGVGMDLTRQKERKSAMK